jgi:hypothetical protein
MKHRSIWCPRTSSLVIVVWILCAGIATAASTSRSLQIVVSAPSWERDDLVATVSLRNVLNPSLESLIRTGVPATCNFTVQLWRNRSDWFDHLERTQSFSYRLHFDLWQETYVVTRPEGSDVIVSTADHLMQFFTNGATVHLARRNEIRSGLSYYIVARAEVGPLSIEDIREMQEWLVGGSRAASRGLLGAGGYAGAFLKTLTGVEGRRASARTELFDAENGSGGPTVHAPR